MVINKWKGQSKAREEAAKNSRKGNQQKKTKQTRNGRDDDEDEDGPINRKQQQLVLNLFKNTFSDVLTSDNFQGTLQAVKQALYGREFAKAFGDPEYLAVYAARWSPTRALCYATVFRGIQQHLREILVSTPGDDQKQTQDQDQTQESEQPEQESSPALAADILNVLSIGGGAAEIVAFGAFLSQFQSKARRSSAESSSTPVQQPAGSITLLDSGPWADVVSQLQTTLTTAPPVSKYASAAVREAEAVPMVHPSRLTSRFIQQDAFSLGREGLGKLINPQNTKKPLLVTLLFTLNELFTAGGIGKTTRFLLDLTSVVPPGTLLLVVDSPGSYSEATLGKEAKKYPMQWLLDRIMSGTEVDPVEGIRWARLESRDSVWFRLGNSSSGSEENEESNIGGLDYPIPLENMRYQMHLYKAEDASISKD